MKDLINLEDLKDLSPEQLAEKVNEANEAYKKTVSDSDRGVQKVLEEKKLAEGALKKLAEINGDNEKLVQAYEENPTLGQYILDTLFGGKSIDEFKSGGGASTAKPDKEKFNEMWEEKKVEERLEKVRSKLSDEVREKFDAELKGFNIKLTTANMEKYIKLALTEANPDFTQEEVAARSTAMSGGVWGAPKQQGGFKRDQATSDFLQSTGAVTPAAKK